VRADPAPARDPGRLTRRPLGERKLSRSPKGPAPPQPTAGLMGLFPVCVCLNGGASGFTLRASWSEPGKLAASTAIRHLAWHSAVKPWRSRHASVASRPASRPSVLTAGGGSRLWNRNRGTVATSRAEPALALLQRQGNAGSGLCRPGCRGAGMAGGFGLPQAGGVGGSAPTGWAVARFRSGISRSTMGSLPPSSRKR